MRLHFISLSELTELIGEADAKEALTTFTVSRDKQLQNWIRNNVFAYEKSNNARSFLLNPYLRNVGKNVESSVYLRFFKQISSILFLISYLD